MKVTQIKSKFLRNIFDQNSYVVENKGEYVLIDAGAELDDIKNVLKKSKLSAIFLTHLHFDHIYNLESIVGAYDCPVYIVDGSEEKLFDCNKNASFMIRNNMVFNIDGAKIKYYTDEIKLKKMTAKIYFTPGHSSDSVCILIGDNLFTGDTIFDDTIGRTDFYDGSAEQMEESLRLLSNLDYKTAYPGHYNIVEKNDIDDVISRIID